MADLPATMPAAVLTGDSGLVVEERPVPRPGPGEVLVEVHGCGICGTDLHLVLDGWGEPGTVPGHEYAGRVAAVGEGVVGLRGGQRVTANPQPGCGRCRGCRRGRPSLCRALDLTAGSWQGGFAGYVRVAAGQVVVLPEGLPLREGVLAEPLAVTLHAIGRGRVSSGDRVLVTGAGPLGLLTVAALRARGVGDVRVSEPVRGRRRCAAAAGAGVTLHPEELSSSVLPPAVVEDPVDVVLECSGAPAAAEMGLANLAPGGRLVVVGAGLDPVELDPTRLMVQELEVLGAINYDPGGLGDAVALLSSGRLPVSDLLEPDAVSLEELSGVMRALAAGRIERKVLVAPGGLADRRP